MIEELVLAAWQHDEIAKKLIEHFPDNPPYEKAIRLIDYKSGGMLPRIEVDVTGKRVYVVASPRSKESTEIDRERLLHMLEATCVAARDNGAKEVIAIMSEHFHDRAHREVKGEPVYARQVAHRMKAAGVDKVMTLAVHSTDQYVFYAEAYGLCKPEDPKEVKIERGHQVLYSLDTAPISTHLFLNLRQKFGLEGKTVYVIRLDQGAERWVSPHIAWLGQSGLKGLDVKRIDFEKHRNVPNDPRSVVTNLLTNVESIEGAVIFIADDKADTLGTIHGALKYLVEREQKGVPAYVFAALPHTLIYKRGHDVVDHLGINIIGSTSNPTRRTKPHIAGLPIFWYDPVNYLFEAIQRCIREGKKPGEVFTPQNYPLFTTARLYSLVKEPATLRRFETKFSQDYDL